MNLNTYRCGCGKIETLPHAKAKPGPCMHDRPWRNTTESGPLEVCYDVGQNGTYLGFVFREQHVLQDGRSWLQVSAKRGRRSFVAAQNQPREVALSALCSLVRDYTHQRRGRAGAFLSALRLLVKQLQFAVAGGMKRLNYEARPWRVQIGEPVEARPAGIKFATVDCKLSAGAGADLGERLAQARSIAMRPLYAAEARIATGAELGAIAERLDLCRSEGETDEELRTRILEKLRGNSRSHGTLEGVANCIRSYFPGWQGIVREAPDCRVIVTGLGRVPGDNRLFRQMDAAIAAELPAYVHVTYE